MLSKMRHIARRQIDEKENLKVVFVCQTCKFKTPDSFFLLGHLLQLQHGFNIEEQD